ncbi:MAG TPA: hypothetical protein PKG52_02745 [bacterium]|nr:hypothetical protein [bacterium]HPS28732.1 hypothetical protein [bacterium]
MNNEKFPIMEFDSKSEPLLKASSFGENIGAPEHCVMTFFPEVIKRLRQSMTQSFYQVFRL